ncbi:MAG: four helix bundle protein [Candidatus Omnitrophica bacterium]|nr:four helix bundle protein [Candidatus Omnitrophota bacterium]
MTNDHSSNIQTKIPALTRGKYFDLEDRTLEFARRVIRTCKRIPPNAINRELVSQLVRSCGSVGANYREANEALSKKDFGYRIKIARKEAKEAHFWLQLLEEAQPALDGETQQLQREAIELRKILSSIAEKVS